MGALTKEEVLSKLKRQQALIEPLKRLTSDSPEFKKWSRDTEVAIERIFGEDSRHVEDFTGIQYSLVVASSETDDSDWEEAYQGGLDGARSILASMIDEVEEYWDRAPSSAGISALERVEATCRRFHLVAKQLRTRHADRSTLDVEDEYDVQDLLHALLHLLFDDIRREEWTPSYAGASSRMDLLLKKEQIVVEVKKTRRGLGAKEVGNELIIDIQRYKTHPDCKTLVCFVYDPEGKIGNPEGLIRDLSKDAGSLKVVVIVAPPGA